jgi:biotin-(acetyl-CoA carboxylase) ligase
LLEPLTRALARFYGLLGSTDGSQKIFAEWTSRSSYASGKFVRVIEGDESFSGTTRGLERDGALRVETDDGKIRVVRAGDVMTVRAA